MITLGRRGDLHARRQATAFLRSRDVVHKLFAEVAPRFKDRPGGYTRIVKLGPRPGDAAEMAYLELVDEEYVAEAQREERATVAPVARRGAEAGAVEDDEPRGDRRRGRGGARGGGRRAAEAADEEPVEDSPTSLAGRADQRADDRDDRPARRDGERAREKLVSKNRQRITASAEQLEGDDDDRRARGPRGSSGSGTAACAGCRRGTSRRR